MLSRNALRRRSAGAFSRSFATETSSHPPSKRPALYASVILNRSPILTRTPTPFESAYYAYQSRIRRTLHNPFPYDFYFKQGSLIETRFNEEERAREKELFGEKFAEEDSSVVDSMGKPDEDALKAVETLSKQEGEGEAVVQEPQVSDVKSLDRNMRRNVYLIVKSSEGWRFPQGGIQKGELLHQAAQRDLHDECGPNMDAWIVSRNPIGHYKPSASEAVTFFYKGHILAGQAHPSSNISDFAWLTKEEIRDYVDAKYWEGVKDMLSDV